MGTLIESLENRRLMSGTGALTWAQAVPGGQITLNLDGTFAGGQGSGVQYHITKRGTLVVEGTDGADTVAITRRSGVVTLYTNLSNTQENTVLPDGAKVHRLLVEAGAGNDIIDASGFYGSATIAGGAGNDKLWGGRGQQLIGGNGNDFLMATAAYTEAASANDDGFGPLLDATPSLLSGGAGRDTLVSAPEAADSLVGGTGVDQLFCTADFPATETLTNTQASALVVQQDGVKLSGVEAFQISQRKPSATPTHVATFNSPFGLLGPFPTFT